MKPTYKNKVQNKNIPKNKNIIKNIITCFYMTYTTKKGEINEKSKIKSKLNIKARTLLK